MSIITDRLKHIRKLRGYTQKELADGLGTVQQQVAKWEMGINEPSSETLIRLAKLLDCSADWLLGLVDASDDHMQVRQISAHEQQLLNLYRRGALPELITRLVTELAGPKAEKDGVIQGDDESIITGG
jgi:transcriptional regulator with XRE-family HTH domain